MSNAVSAVQGASFKGSISVNDAGLQGMITLRGDLGSDDLAKAVKAAVGLAVPGVGKVNSGKKGSVAWMSPDELFLMLDYTAADATVAKLDKALAGSHMLAVNVSDARAVFNLEGTAIRDVLAKGSPANMSTQALGIDALRRTRLGQLPVAFWMGSETTATVICFRSVGAHVYSWLTNAAQKGATPEYYS